MSLLRFKTASTQCNLFLLNLVNRKSKLTQTVRVLNPCKSIGIQTCLAVSNPGTDTGQVNKEKEPKIVFLINSSKSVTKVKTEVENASTQCCLGIRYPCSRKDRPTQTEDYSVPPRTQDVATTTSSKGNNESQTSSQALPELPVVLKRVVSLLQEDVLKDNLCYEARKNNRGEHCLILKHAGNLALPGEDIDPIQVVITQSGKCSIFKLFKTVEITNLVLQGVLMEDKLHEVLLPLVDSTYVFCPGIKTTDMELHPKSVVSFTYPMLRAQASECPVWYKRVLNCIPQKFKVIQCIRCSSAYKTILAKKKRRLEATIEGKESVAQDCKKARVNRVRKSKKELKENVPELENGVSVDVDLHS